MQSNPQSARMELMPRQSAILTGIVLEGPPQASHTTLQENHQAVIRENQQAHHADFRTLDNALQAVKTFKMGK